MLLFDASERSSAEFRVKQKNVTPLKKERINNHSGIHTVHVKIRTTCLSGWLLWMWCAENRCISHMLPSREKGFQTGHLAQVKWWTLPTASFPHGRLIYLQARFIYLSVSITTFFLMPKITFKSILLLWSYLKWNKLIQVLLGTGLIVNPSSSPNPNSALLVLIAVQVISI